MTTENEGSFNQGSFEESADSLPDGGKAGHERREAEANAIASKMKSVWLNLQQIEERKKFLEKSKWMMKLYALIGVGVLVNIFYEGVKGELQIGTTIMVLGGVGILAYQYDLWNERKRVKMLQREEAAYLAKWLACGARRESFEALHALCLEEHALGKLTDASEMEMSGKRAALDIKMAKLWNDIKLELHRDTGEGIPAG
ncbi:MAG: hypothetical protein ABI167_00855 [Nitrosospira sp.]